jgi:hypothetical protein
MVVGKGDIGIGFLLEFGNIRDENHFTPVAEENIRDRGP